MTARTLMNPKLAVVRATDTVSDAANLIVKHHLRRLPVVDERGRYLGTCTPISSEAWCPCRCSSRQAVFQWLRCAGFMAFKVKSERNRF